MNNNMRIDSYIGGVLADAVAIRKSRRDDMSIESRRTVSISVEKHRKERLIKRIK